MQRNNETGDNPVPVETNDEPVFAVNVTPAVLGSIADYFEINGEVTAASSVETYADVQGILGRLHVRLGDKVRKGDVIAEVDPSRPGLNYALSPVLARASGTITALPMDVGDAVSAQSSIVTIGDLSKLKVETAIPERFISRIRPGMPAEIRLESWPGHVIELTVTELDPVVDSSSRTLGISMDLPADSPEWVKAGMYAEIRLTTDEKDAVIKIPADTVLRRFGESFVFVVENDRAVKRLITPGITLEGAVEIISGLQEGEQVVYQGQTLLEDGVALRVVRTQNVLGDEVSGETP